MAFIPTCEKLCPFLCHILMIQDYSISFFVLFQIFTMNILTMCSNIYANLPLLFPFNFNVKYLTVQSCDCFETSYVNKNKGPVYFESDTVDSLYDAVEPM